MSRCLPYPPPRYLPRSGGINEPLIEESIKLRNHKENAKAESKKEKKREDKKRKREVHLNQAIDGLGHGEQGKLNSDKARKLKKLTASLKGKYVQSRGEDEGSDITEEHEQPVRLPKPSLLTGDGQNSNKRGQQESEANMIHIKGNILRIRLSSLKQKDHGDRGVEDLQPSTSGMPDHPTYHGGFEAGQRLQGQPCSNLRSPVLGETPINNQPGRAIADASFSGQGKAVPKSWTSKLSKVALIYNELFESWAPPKEQGSEGEELDWLLPRKSRSREKTEAACIAPCSVGSNLWPVAQFLPAADMYALPYTVPF